MQEFLEADRAEWFPPDRAVEKLLPGQRPIVPALLKLLVG
jgi:predicted NUDIX family NTP pyrophosphohydrolase